METGILLIAVGDVFYGQLAYGMANSIKKNTNIPIAVLTDDTALKYCPNKSIFDKIITLNFCDYLDNGVFNPFKAKTLMYDKTPFKNTLYLDVDALCVKPIDTLMAKLQETDLQIYEVRRYNPEQYRQCTMVWYKTAGVTLDVALKAYDVTGLYPEYNSSFVWFKKNADTAKFFEQVKKNYFDRRIKYRDIGLCYPDELAFNLASMQTNKYCKYEGLRPIYFNWDSKGKNLTLAQIQKDYYFLGMAGGATRSQQVAIYNRLNGHYGFKFSFDNRKKIIHRK